MSTKLLVCAVALFAVAGANPFFQNMPRRDGEYVPFPAAAMPTTGAPPAAAAKCPEGSFAMGPCTQFCGAMGLGQCVGNNCCFATPTLPPMPTFHPPLGGGVGAASSGAPPPERPDHPKGTTGAGGGGGGMCVGPCTAGLCPVGYNCDKRTEQCCRGGRPQPPHGGHGHGHGRTTRPPPFSGERPPHTTSAGSFHGAHIVVYEMRQLGSISINFDCMCEHAGNDTEGGGQPPLEHNAQMQEEVKLDMKRMVSEEGGEHGRPPMLADRLRRFGLDCECSTSHVAGHMNVPIGGGLHGHGGHHGHGGRPSSAQSGSGEGEPLAPESGPQVPPIAQSKMSMMPMPPMRPPEPSVWLNFGCSCQSHNESGGPPPRPPHGPMPMHGVHKRQVVDELDEEDDDDMSASHGGGRPHGHPSGKEAFDMMLGRFGLECDCENIHLHGNIHIPIVVRKKRVIQPHHQMPPRPMPYADL